MSSNSRRKLLKAMGLGAGTLALNACGITDPSLSGCKVYDMPTSYAQPFTQSPEQSPNVIVIFTDDQGWGDAASFGHPYLKTPNIDKLVDEGTWFQQFYVNSAVCSPSRAALMTGQFPSRTNVHGHFSKLEQNAARCMPNWLEPNLPTMADIFKAAGYKTGQFGKWHLSSEHPDAVSPLEYGFDEERTVISNKSGWDREEIGLFWAKSTDLFVNETMRFISDTVNESQKSSQRIPFFANLWTYVPHAPYQLRPDDRAEYVDLVADPNDFPAYMANYMRRAPDLQLQMKTYCAAVTGLDKAIGRLLDFLESSQLSNDTLIIFASDNGPEDYAIVDASKGGMGSAGKFRGRKRSLYEGGIRTPLVVRWPGVVKAGDVNTNSVVTAIDFIPTLTKMAGISLPTTMPLDGEDVSDILLGNKRNRSKSIFWEHRFTTFGAAIDSSPPLMVRSGDWKYLTNTKGTRGELYNIKDDIEERRNVVVEEPEIASSLKTELNDWYTSL